MLAQRVSTPHHDSVGCSSLRFRGPRIRCTHCGDAGLVVDRPPGIRTDGFCRTLPRQLVGRRVDICRRHAVLHARRPRVAGRRPVLRTLRSGNASRHRSWRGASRVELGGYRQASVMLAAVVGADGARRVERPARGTVAGNLVVFANTATWTYAIDRVAEGSGYAASGRCCTRTTPWPPPAFGAVRCRCRAGIRPWRSRPPPRTSSWRGGSTWRIVTRNAALLYAGAVGVASLRVVAGKHFPTDVIAGAALGSGIGWLVPTIHPTSP